MANSARAKGTRWETELLEPLRALFGPQVERAPLKGEADAGDFTGVPWLHEAKSTKVPRFLDWARTATAKARRDNPADPSWVILWHGDRRAKDLGPCALMPLALYERITAGWGSPIPAEWAQTR